MAYYFELKGPAYTALIAGVQKITKECMVEGHLAEDEMVVRSLRPEDFGLSNPSWDWNIASGSAWNTVRTSTTFADMTWCCVIGFCDKEATRLVSEIEFTRKGKLSRIWTNQQTHAQESKTTYVDDPITIGQREAYQIRMYESTGGTNSTYELAFIGVIAEKRGLVVA